MKKITYVAFLLIFCLSLIAGCQKSYKPDPEVEEYLNGDISAQNAMNAVKTANYTVKETKSKFDGTVTGTSVTEVFIDLTDKNSRVVRIKITTDGDYSDGKTKESLVTIKRENSVYVHQKTENGKTETKEVTEDFATDYVTKLFFTFNDAYYEGGLYYGDYFRLYIYKYPSQFFFVDKENDLCAFHQARFVEYKDVGKVTFVQKTKINRLGLLRFNEERYESEEKDFSLVSTLNADYVYFETKA